MYVNSVNIALQLLLYHGLAPSFLIKFELIQQLEDYSPFLCRRKGMRRRRIREAVDAQKGCLLVFPYFPAQNISRESGNGLKSRDFPGFPGNSRQY